MSPIVELSIDLLPWVFELMDDGDGHLSADELIAGVSKLKGAARILVLFLIPHTQSVVHLHDKAIGARVNLEADIIGKYVERLLGGHRPTDPASTGVDYELLARTGFIK